MTSEWQTNKPPTCLSAHSANHLSEVPGKEVSIQPLSSIQGMALCICILIHDTCPSPQTSHMLKSLSWQCAHTHSLWFSSKLVVLSLCLSFNYATTFFSVYWYDTFFITSHSFLNLLTSIYLLSTLLKLFWLSNSWLYFIFLRTMAILYFATDSLHSILLTIIFK